MIGPIARALTRRQAAVVLLALEVGFGFAVSVEAFAFGQWFSDKAHAPDGMSPHVLIVTSDLAGEPGAAAELVDLRQRDVAALRSLPGVAAVAPAFHVPQQRILQAHAVEAPGEAGSRWAVAWQLDGQPETLDGLGVAVTAGRALRAGQADDVVISANLAAALFDGPAIGKTLRLRGRTRSYTVVGVTAPVRALSAFALGTDQVLFLPDPMPLGREQRYLVRAEEGRMADVRARIAPALAAVHGDRVVDVRSLPECRAHNDRSARGGIGIFTFMVVLALLVTLLGSLAMSSFLVAERTKQIGTRRALGATKGDIVRYFLTENFLVTTVGLVLGLPLSYGLHLLAKRQQPDILLDGGMILLGMAMFWVTGLLAALVPALRATTVPPSAASRTI